MMMPAVIPALGASARMLTAPRARAFRAALADPRAAQDHALRRITAGLARSRYGQRRGLPPNADYAAYAAALPIVTHADLADDIERAAQGAPDEFWPGRIAHWETTSGSSGPKKRVPISAELRQVFSEAVHIWINDLLATAYRPRTGRLFMAIAPPTQQSLTHEASFVRGPLGLLVRAFLIAPPHLARLHDPRAFRRALLVALLEAEDLEVVSLWNPSYLLALLDLAAQDPGAFAKAARLSGARAEALRALEWGRLWPALKVISAWDSAAAAGPAALLQRMFPAAFVQGKGLITTETPVTIPIAGAHAPIPFIDRVLVELEGDDGAVVRLTDATIGGVYRLITSSVGGFARYDLGDLVRVRPGIGATPGLEFVGRADAVSDLVGEKLHEMVVQEAMARTLGPVSALLLPQEASVRPAHYVLAVEQVDECAVRRLELALCEGHHYARARALGQLDPIRAAAVPRLRERYFLAMANASQRLDSIKDRALVPDPEHSKRLTRALISHASCVATNS
jgi:hypothetical protein